MSIAQTAGNHFPAAIAIQFCLNKLTSVGPAVCPAKQCQGKPGTWRQVHRLVDCSQGVGGAGEGGRGDDGGVCCQTCVFYFYLFYFFAL
jgi:hypothetical protein